MKAIEAAEHSDVIYNPKRQVVFVKIDGKWVNDDLDEFQIHQLQSEDYVPLVPKKIYKVGDKVTFLEALNSGMCFRLRNEATIQKFDGKLKYYSHSQNCWRIDDNEHVNGMARETYTLCEDPSIPPKPTLESLPAWTRCKVKPVNYAIGICDVIKKPGGSFEYYDSGNGFGFVNVKLISFYNPKTEQWEDV